MGVALRVGFHGAGFITAAHRWLLRHSAVDHQLVAVHDPDRARAERFAEATAARIVDERALPELADVVFVCSWTSEHPRLVASAAQGSCAVFCEKPLAVDAERAAKMIATVDGAGVVNQVGLILRFLPGYIVARALLADDRAGDVMAVNFSDDQFIPIQGRYASTWRADPARAGRGALLEHSIHDVDMLGWLFGPVAAVSAITRERHGLARIDDATVAHLQFESGALGTLTTVWHDVLERANVRRLEVLCERLHLVVDGDSDAVLRWRFGGEDEQVLTGAALADAACAVGGEDSGPLVTFGSGYAFNPLTRFLVAARDDGPSPLPLSEAAAAHDLVDAMYRSAAEGGAVVRELRS